MAGLLQVKSRLVSLQQPATQYVRKSGVCVAISVDKGVQPYDLWKSCSGCVVHA